MGAAAYKKVYKQIPQFIIDKIEGFDLTTDPDGDLWEAAGLYIELLEHNLVLALTSDDDKINQQLVEHIL